MAQGARRDHRVGSRLPRLLDRLDQLGEGDVLACLDDREATALDLPGKVDGSLPQASMIRSSDDGLSGSSKPSNLEGRRIWQP